VIVLLRLLTALTLLAAALRACPGQRPARLAPPTGPGLQAQVLAIERVPVAPATYQVAALVQRYAAPQQLRHRRLLALPEGVVALGHTSAGQPALHTCLMATGVAAVTFEQMQAEVLRTAPLTPPQRHTALLAAALVGRPWHQRSCRLVLLQRQPGTHPTRLLRDWRALRTQLLAPSR
jgi:hypothetical protein